MEVGGGASKRNKNPSRAAASMQAAARRSQSRVILVEPRDLVRDCVAMCLRVADPGLAVEEYSSVHDVDSTQSADAIALVLSFPSPYGEIPDVSAVVARARDHLPKVPIVLVADDDELSFVRKVIDLGVRGYIPTSFDFATFREAIQFVAAGGTFVPASVLLQHEVGQMRNVDEPDDRATQESKEPMQQNWNEAQERITAASFTPRELAVISHLKGGKSNKLIARELAIREGTVKIYIRRIMKKLQVENRTQAALAVTNMQLAG
jgi:DNA-binding NarL/FixJ family response regulator